MSKRMNHQHQGKRRKGELTPLQEAFVDAYMETRSARRAAELAGYADPAKRGWFTLQVKAVADEISRRKEEIRKRNEHMEDQVIQELAAVAFASMDDFVDFTDGTLRVKSLDEIPEELRGCIKEVTLIPGKYGDKIQIKLHDKMVAVKMLGDYMALWGDKNLAAPLPGQPGAQPIQVVTGIERQPGGEDWSDL